MSQHATPSSAKEPLRKELTQCQHCYKSRLASGVSLSKCAGCKIALYCSRECQKAAWTAHKETCRLNRRQYAAPPAQVDGLQRLRAFSAKHRPTIAEYGIRALELSADPTRALRDIVVVLLQPRAGAESEAKKAETAFVVTGVSVAPVEAFGAGQAEELRGQLRYYDAEQKRTGMWGGIMVMLLDTESGVSNVCPVGFGADIMQLKPGQPWKEEMMARMNAGVVY